MLWFSLPSAPPPLEAVGRRYKHLDLFEKQPLFVLDEEGQSLHEGQLACSGQRVEGNTMNTIGENKVCVGTLCGADAGRSCHTFRQIGIEHRGSCFGNFIFARNATM